MKYITGKELAERWRMDYKNLCNQMYLGKFPIKRVRLAANTIVFDMDDVIAYEQSVKSENNVK